MPTDPPLMQETCQKAVEFEERHERLPTIRELAELLGITYMAAYFRNKNYQLGLPADRKGPRKGGRS